MKSNTLPTAAQIALARATVAVKAEDKAEARADFASRLDPDAWTCRRAGGAWIAEGPAGNCFRFTKAINDEDVDCLSHTGGLYLLAMDDDAKWCCTCPDAARRPGATGCKHTVAFYAVRKAAAAKQAA